MNSHSLSVHYSVYFNTNSYVYIVKSMLFSLDKRTALFNSTYNYK